MERIIGLVVILSLSAWMPAPLSAQDAGAPSFPVLQTLIDLWDYEQAGRPPDRSLSFEFPEASINLYLASSLKLKPRPGLSSLSVELLPDNRIVATAKVDVRRLIADDPTLIPAKLREPLIGAGPLKAEFHFRVESGHLTLSVKPVNSSGLAIPGAVLDKMVRRLASIQPEKLDIGKPIPLPWGLKMLYTRAKLLGGGT